MSACAPAALLRCETPMTATLYRAARLLKGARRHRTSAFLWLSVPPRYAEMGSITTAATPPNSLSFASRACRSSCRQKVLSSRLPSPVYPTITPSTTWTRRRQAAHRCPRHIASADNLHLGHPGTKWVGGLCPQNGPMPQHGPVDRPALSCGRVCEPEQHAAAQALHPQVARGTSAVM